jgi:hypothetical protein
VSLIVREPARFIGFTEGRIAGNPEMLGSEWRSFPVSTRTATLAVAVDSGYVDRRKRVASYPRI